MGCLLCPSPVSTATGDDIDITTLTGVLGDFTTDLTGIWPQPLSTSDRWHCLNHDYIILEISDKMTLMEN